MMIALNMIDAGTLSGATEGYEVLGAALPHAIYPLAVTVLAASGAAFVLGNARLLARTGHGVIWKRTTPGRLKPAPTYS
jgi:hypothetical protein